MIIHTFKKVEYYALSCSRGKLILFSILAGILLSLSLASLFVLIGMDKPSQTPFEYERNNTHLFIVSVIIAPLIETFLFQFLPFFIMRKFIKNKYIIVLISGLIFGGAHYFNEQSFLEVGVVSLIGILYAYIFYIGLKRVDTHPFFIVALIHGGYNLLVFLMKVTFLRELHVQIQIGLIYLTFDG